MRFLLLFHFLFPLQLMLMIIFLLLVHYVVGQVSFQFDFNINNSISTFPDL